MNPQSIQIFFHLRPWTRLQEKPNKKFIFHISHPKIYSLVFLLFSSQYHKNVPSFQPFSFLPRLAIPPRAAEKITPSKIHTKQLFLLLQLQSKKAKWKIIPKLFPHILFAAALLAFYWAGRFSPALILYVSLLIFSVHCNMFLFKRENWQRRKEDPVSGHINLDLSSRLGYRTQTVIKIHRNMYSKPNWFRT